MRGAGKSSGGGSEEKNYTRIGYKIHRLAGRYGKTGSEIALSGTEVCCDGKEVDSPLRAGRPEMRIKIRWCPAYEGVEGNEEE